MSTYTPITPITPPARSAYPREPIAEAAVTRPKSRWLRVLAAVGAGLAFLALALSARGVPFFPIDLEITLALQSLHSPWLAIPFQGLNAFGFAPIVTITFAAVIVLLLFAGRRWEAVSAAFATVGAAGLTEIVKGMVMRPRPSAELVNVAHQIESSGFPAGHVLNFTPFVGFLGYLAYVRLAPSWRRTSLIVVLLVAIALMGPARIYDGEHWASDVLGSYLLGFVWLTISIAFYEWGVRKRERAGKA